MQNYIVAADPKHRVWTPVVVAGDFFVGFKINKYI